MEWWVLILFILGALGATVFFFFVNGRLGDFSEAMRTSTDLSIIAQQTTGTGPESSECTGLNFIVSPKEGQIEEDGTFMSQCGLIIYNCGPGNVNLKDVTLTWELGTYYNGQGQFEDDVLTAGGDPAMIGCGQVIDHPVTVKISTDEFVLKIPAKVTFTSPTGTRTESWEVTYISNKGKL